MVITGESVEERKARLSEEAERAGVQAHAPDVERIADDEDTEDDEAFKEQELVRKAQERIHAKYMDRLARVKIDRCRLVGEDKLLVKQCVYRSAKSKQPTVAWPAVVPESMIHLEPVPWRQVHSASCRQTQNVRSDAQPICVKA